MPEETFIPISTTFKSIADSRRATAGASWNLLETFDKLPISSNDPPVAMQFQTSVPIDIVPTVQASPSPLSVTEEGSGLMLNEITQTDIIGSVCMQEVQMDVPEFKMQGTEMVDFIKSTETQTTIAHVQSHKVQTDFLVESKEVQTFVS